MKKPAQLYAHILYHYVIKTCFLAMLISVLGLWLLQLVFAYLSELENISDTYTYQSALQFVLYKSPYFLGQFMPTGVLLGAVVGLGLLANNSELVVMRAMGISILQIIMLAMTPALLFVVILLGINQFVLPASNDLANKLRSPTSNIIALHGYWAVNQDGNDTHIINIDYADNLGNLNGIKQYTLNGSTLRQSLRASTGVTTQNPYTWQLNDIDIITLDGQATTQNKAQTQLILPIDKSSIHLLTKSADDLSISDLYAHKSLMTHQNSRSIRHELSFWQKIFNPFAMLSLVLVACSFVFGSLRSQGLGARICLSLLTGLLFSYLQDLSGFVALAYQLSPFVMALLPMLISGVAGVYFIGKKR